MKDEASLLARLSGVANKPVDDRWLRARTFANCAAALGRQTEGHRVRRSLPESFGATPGDRAFLYAALCHARTQDDFFPPGRVHVGAVVLPAALAVLDRPDRFLPALRAGYETLTVISEGYGRLAQARGYRPTGLFGAFGAAAAATVAAGGDSSEREKALAFAAMSTSGTNQAWIEGTDEWVLEVAIAARAGVEAASFAAGGLSSAAQALDGQAAWAGAFFQDPTAERLRSALADERPRTPEVAIKQFPVSGIAQVPTTLACRLAEVVDLADIVEIVVQIPESDLAYPGTASMGPFRSRGDALMSVPLCVALGLVHGTIPYTHLAPTEDKRLHHLLQRMRIGTAPDLDDTDARVKIRTPAKEHQLRGSGRDILYPTWPQLVDEVETLAQRSEAPLALVREVARALNCQVPDAGRLRDLLDAAVRS